MQETTPDGAVTGETREDRVAKEDQEEPQRRQRERSGMLGEPAGIPPGSHGGSDGAERSDPVHEQVPQDGDHWRR